MLATCSLASMISQISAGSIPLEAQFEILTPANHGRIVQDASLDSLWLEIHSCGIKFVEWLLPFINLQRNILN